MNRRFLLTALFLALAAVPTRAQDASIDALRRELTSILQDESTSNGWWGVSIVDLDREESLFSQSSGKSFVPASNTKLYTTASALTLLGPDFRYRTELYASGQVENGTLPGPIIVRGSGDPSFGPRFSGDGTLVFRQWADSLRALGITTIAGDVVGDDDLFDDVPLGNGWSWDDEPFWYAAEISGLSYFDNTIDLTVKASTAGQPARLSWEPISTSYIDVVNATSTLPRGARVDEDYHRDRGTNRFRIGTAVPEGGSDLESLTVTNPTLYFVHVLREALVAAGIVVLGSPRDIDEASFKPDYAMLTRVATHVSPPLAEIVKVVNKPSQNLYAEQLLRTMGAHGMGAGSADAGWKAAMPYLAQTGIDTTRIQLTDGSGLSRTNLVTPDMTVSLLRHVWTRASRPVRDAFVESLPIGGVDGTLSARFREGRSRGNVRAKTGTVSNVSSLSGYVTTAGGSQLAFSIMSNHFTSPASRSRAVQDRIVETLARFGR